MKMKKGKEVQIKLCLNMTSYRNRVQLKEIFRNQVFKLFTDAVGGNLDEFTDLVYNRFVVEAFYYADDFKYHTIHNYMVNMVVPHKIAVYQSGMELLKSDWFPFKEVDKELFLDNLWIHDISKFSAAEALGYAFYDRRNGANKDDFDTAWNHHQKHNEHHPEYWMKLNKQGACQMLPMPDIYLIEMIADWMGAGKTYGSTLE